MKHGDGCRIPHGMDTDTGYHGHRDRIPHHITYYGHVKKCNNRKPYTVKSDIDEARA